MLNLALLVHWFHKFSSFKDRIFCNKAELCKNDIRVSPPRAGNDDLFFGQGWIDFILKIKVGFSIDVIGRYRQQFEFVSVFSLLRSECDRSTKLIPLSQSMRSKIKTSFELLAHVSPSLAPAV